MQKAIEIPEDRDKFPILKLFTTVKVFEDEILGENDSSITMPIKFYNFRENESITHIRFWYTQGDNPKIESEMVKQHEMVL
jgi:hypothetical protein